MMEWARRRMRMARCIMRRAWEMSVSVAWAISSAVQWLA
jgi:hypothetical protein